MRSSRLWWLLVELGHYHSEWLFDTLSLSLMSNKSIKLSLTIKKSGVLTFLTKVRLHSRSSDSMSKENCYACNPERRCEHVPQKVWCLANLSSLTSDFSSFAANLCENPLPEFWLLLARPSERTCASSTKQRNLNPLILGQRRLEPWDVPSPSMRLHLKPRSNRRSLHTSHWGNMLWKSNSIVVVNKYLV